MCKIRKKTIFFWNEERKSNLAHTFIYLHDICFPFSICFFSFHLEEHFRIILSNPRCYESRWKEFIADASYLSLFALDLNRKKNIILSIEADRSKLRMIFVNINTMSDSYFHKYLQTLVMNSALKRMWELFKNIENQDHLYCLDKNLLR